MLVPNGIRANKQGTKLYVTDTPEPDLPGVGESETSGGQLVFHSTASSAIYVFDLTEDGFPINKRLFGLPERGSRTGCTSTMTVGSGPGRRMALW